MSNPIIDTQDGYCIWQTYKPVAGKIRAVLSPVSDGVKNYGVFDILTGNCRGLYKDYDDASHDQRHKFEDTYIMCLTSGKFP
jgi:hypothetical protein